jgi:CRP-like cAMP-binding protein
MQQKQHPHLNHLLAALPATELERLKNDLIPVRMPLGSVLFEAGCALQHVYFPTTAIVSMLYAPVEGVSAEIAMVGNEGVLGIALFLGGETPLTRAVVKSAGWGYQLSAAQMRGEYSRGGAFMVLMLRYTQTLVGQMTQTAICNHMHSMEQQLARWLLLSLDRLASDSLTLTQELMATMLGIQGERVPAATAPLQQAGLIRYEHGHLQLLDRRKLERRACSCYTTVKRDLDRLLSDIPPGDRRGLLSKSRPQ